MNNVRRIAMTLVLLAAAARAGAEEITLTTYYPSPRGVYDQLRTLHDTRLAEQGGGVSIGGTVAPAEMLDLQRGNLRMPVTTATDGILMMGPDRFLHAFGTENTFLGWQAGNLTMTGGTNTGVGYQVLLLNTSGIDNTAVGSEALVFNGTGRSNTAIGVRALKSNSPGQGNTAVGNDALRLNTNGDLNTAVGSYALVNNVNGIQNTAVGFYALLKNLSGSGNVAIGGGAGDGLFTGSYNTFIGVSARPSSGALTNATAIGAFALVGASNALVLGGTGTNAVSVGIGTATPAAGFALDVVGKIQSTATVGTDAPTTVATKDYVDTAAGGLSWQGFTSAAYNGNLGGLYGANVKCDSQYPGSHWASADEIARLGVSFPNTTGVWVRDGVAGWFWAGAGYVILARDGLVQNLYVDNCAGWNIPNNYGAVWDPNVSSVNFASCGSFHRLACVK